MLKSGDVISGPAKGDLFLVMYDGKLSRLRKNYTRKGFTPELLGDRENSIFNTESFSDTELLFNLFELLEKVGV
jgi:hypothetical protein